RELNFSYFPPFLIKVRELNFSYFPPLQGGIKGGNNAIQMTANYFSNILLVTAMEIIFPIPTLLFHSNSKQV
ncbi:hypothetical protein, partial [Scytonema sp. NUACC26]|uniref:hypothetical protein n=1 Tax=Scytonema sp. NUACC26 TaxID=3140176 RepID=UPI0038B3ED6D